MKAVRRRLVEVHWITMAGTVAATPIAVVAHVDGWGWLGGFGFGCLLGSVLSYIADVEMDYRERRGH